jgi:hypothetical protein
MPSKETKECKVGDLPSSLKREIQSLMREGENELICVITRTFDPAALFGLIPEKDLNHLCFVVTDRRCISVYGFYPNDKPGRTTASWYGHLSDITGITYLEGFYTDIGGRNILDQPMFTVRVDCPGHPGAGFIFESRPLALRFREILGRAVDAQRAASQDTSNAVEARLTTLKRLLEEGLIDSSAYENARRKALETL